MSISSRHHYIPQFLIKNFADSENKLWVYDKTTKRISVNKQSPKAIFFERDRNLIEINGEKVDNIEKMYSEMDNLLAKTLDKILSTHEMTGRELTLMIFLVSVMKWRVPKIDETLYNLANNIHLKNLGVNIRPININEPPVQNIDEMEFADELKRLLIPIQPLLSEDNLNIIHESCFIVSNDKVPGLLGDCPIIESKNEDFKNLGDFVFPLSSTDTLVCKRGSKKKSPHYLFYLQKDLLIFHLAKKYVACKSREQLESVISMYSNVEKENKVHLLEKYIFKSID